MEGGGSLALCVRVGGGLNASFLSKMNTIGTTPIQVSYKNFCPCPPPPPQGHKQNKQMTFNPSPPNVLIQYLHAPLYYQRATLTKLRRVLTKLVDF